MASENYLMSLEYPSWVILVKQLNNQSLISLMATSRGIYQKIINHVRCRVVSLKNWPYRAREVEMSRLKKFFEGLNIVSSKVVYLPFGKRVMYLLFKTFQQAQTAVSMNGKKLSFTWYSREFQTEICHSINVNIREVLETAEKLGFEFSEDCPRPRPFPFYVRRYVFY